VSTQRAELGASQNRFEKAVSGIDIAAENLQAAESRIRDADIAKEMVSYSRDQILQQAGTAMLAQANVQTQSVLQLLG
ncbi:MAG: flagellin, partial [Treponema sp.]|nr:flagellin [Treponema sp.]